MKKISLMVGFLWLGIMGASAQIKDNCDVNGDGEVNIADVIYVVDHVLGKHDLAAVDLGLPSGTKWAPCNVGANKPEEYGGYYAWGETEMKETYTVETYQYYENGSYVSLGDISGTEYDVAHVKWGGKWCMPTADDFNELLANCTSERTTLNGVVGMKFTSNINGKSIFLPAGGSYLNQYPNGIGVDGLYWSATEYEKYNDYAYQLYFATSTFFEPGNRYYGHCVRPVIRE